MKRILLLFSLLLSFSFYGQNDSLSLVRHTENDLITPKNLKVVFRGLPNELFIDVPNAKSFEVSGNGITKKDKNTYTLNPGAGSETTVIIDIILKNNKKVIEKHVFRIRNTGSIITTFNKQGDGVLKLQKNRLKDGVVEVKLSDKNIEQFIQVTQFTIKIPGIEGIIVNGNKIDSVTYEKINRYASKGDQITVSDIKSKTIKVSTGPICGISPIVIIVL